jgi:lipopolysaccharide/colanic/teichoic acid biosynthesis glycosyltransferase/glycosyltransferase involved in cell wall biosynthesis
MDALIMSQPAAAHTATLRCTVVVPVYNGARTIQRCLDALAAQTLPADEFEVIVVSDGSTDDTDAVVQRWLDQNVQNHWRLVRQANAGPGAARNYGADEAQAPLLLFTDADCAPHPDWVAAMLTVFADPSVAGAKGVYSTRQTAPAPLFVQAEYEDRYDRMHGQERIDFIDTYSAAYRRHVFCENGGFDTIFTTASVEDQELSFRIAAKGYRLVFTPDAKVEHIHDENLAEYCRRKYFIGFWKALLTRWHPERVVQDSHTPQVLKVQMLLWGAILGLIPVALLGTFHPLFQLAGWGVLVALLIFLITTLPFVTKLARRSWRLAVLGPVMLAARSLSLGLGYVVGTVHFAGTLPGQREPVIPGWKRLIKRGMDILGALIGLAVSTPFILLAALAIKLDSPGPIFYVQTRIGEHGRPFRIVKLRSMTYDADRKLDQLINLDELTEPAYKLPNDPRVTRVGSLLRRSSLDETPQFWNVLRGEMSLVGPRPEAEPLVQRYNDHQRRRLLVKPGLTGPMQVSGRGDLPFADRLRLELDYIEHYSLRRDIAIILRTLPAVWAGKGAR